MGAGKAVATGKAIGLDKRQELFVAVNLSPMQLHQRDFGDKLKKILKENDFSASLPCLELTEEAALKNLPVK